MGSGTEHERDSASPAPVDSGSGTLGRIAVDLFGCRDTQAVLRQVVDVGRSLGGADGALVLLYDPERDHFMPAVPDVAAGRDDSWLQRYGLGAMQGLARRAIAASDLLIEDLAAGGRAGPPPPGADPRLEIAWVLPMAGECGVVGVLALFRARSTGVDPEPEVLRTFAALAGLAIANSQVRESARALRIRLEALNEATKAFAAGLSPDQVLRRIVEIAAGIAGARYGALGVAGADGYLTDFITTGLSAEERTAIGPLPRGHGLLGVLVREGLSLRVPDIGQDPRMVGFPPHHPPMTSLLGVPIRLGNAVVGDLYLTDKIGSAAFSEDDQRLVEMLAAHAGIAIENARLYAESAEVTRLRERERIARDLHDGIIQDIYAATLRLEDLGEDLRDVATRARLGAVANGLLGVIGDVRSYIQGLRAHELDGHPHGEAIAALVREIASPGGPTSSLAFEGMPVWLPDETATALLQIAREALTNAIRHARATHVEVTLAYAPAGVTLTVRDDGTGFDPDAPRGEEHLGLRNLRARAEAARGSLTVSSSPGGGTTIKAFLPAPSPPT